MSSRSNSVSRAMLQEQLRLDAPVRERSIARFMAAISALLVPLVAVLGLFIGWKLALSLILILSLLVGYYGALFVALSRGWYRSVIAWVNVALETSIPAVFFVFDAHFLGPEYALTAPPLAIWGGLIALSALRMQRRLAFLAGGVAATEYLLLYWLFVLPQMGPPALVTLGPVFIAVRALLLLCCGALTALVASHLLRKAEEAITALRERDVFGKYLLHERIGSGGMAEVFRATYCPEGGFQKPVAIKRVLPAYAEDAEFLALFQREAALCSQLAHPNVVHVFDMGRHEGAYYLAMEYVDGISLRNLVRGASTLLPLSVVAFIGAEMGAALEYLRQRTALGGPGGLVHRDVNPPNILISCLGEVKLTDFGIARATERAAVTLTEGVRGKVGYMAPEQVQGLPLDTRADLFALGLTLHEILTGDRLLGGDSDRARMEASLRQQLPPPSARRPDCPPELDAAVMGLLERDLDLRTSSGGKLREQLLHLSGVSAPYPDGQEQLARLVQRVKAPGEPADNSSLLSALDRRPLSRDVAASADGMPTRDIRPASR
jgi:serine/threonine protein kinase